MSRVLYFGCWDRTGHYLHDSGGRSSVDIVTPWGDWCRLDGTLAPKDRSIYQPDDVSALHIRDGWAALAFWDRSADQRGNSNAVFLVEGVATFDEVVAAAEASFPQIVKRFRVWPPPVVETHNERKDPHA